MLHRLGVLITGLAGAGAVLAQASVGLNVADNGNQSAPSGSGSVVFSSSTTLDGGSASGYANLSSGTLRASAVAPLGPYTQASATSNFADYVTFNAGATGTAYLDWHWDGTLSSPVNVAGATANLGLVVDYGDVPTGVSEAHALTNNHNNGCFNFATPYCSEGTSINQSGTLAFAIHPGANFIEVQLVVSTDDGQAANFSNTGNFYLRVPDGVTYTSNSSQFLSTATPITAVPEPSTYALLLGGICIVGYRNRRRKN